MTTTSTPTRPAGSTELRARTSAGGDLVALAEWLADDFPTCAAEHQGARLLRDAGYLAAPIPVELGGLGVGSVHDLVVASSRLARGDAGLAIAVNAHLVAVVALERRRRVAAAAGDAHRAGALAATLTAIAEDDTVLAATAGEPALSALFHASVSLGVAEAAVAERVGDDAHARTLAAGAADDLAAARGVLGRAASRVDDHHAAHAAGDDAAAALLAQAQAAETLVRDAAARVVNRALALAVP